MNVIGFWQKYKSVIFLLEYSTISSMPIVFMLFDEIVGNVGYFYRIWYIWVLELLWVHILLPFFEDDPELLKKTAYKIGTVMTLLESYNSMPWDQSEHQEDQPDQYYQWWWRDAIWVYTLEEEGYLLSNIRRVPKYPFIGCNMLSALNQDPDCQNQPTRSQDMTKFIQQSLWNWPLTSFRTTLWLFSCVLRLSQEGDVRVSGERKATSGSQVKIAQTPMEPNGIYIIRGGFRALKTRPLLLQALTGIEQWFFALGAHSTVHCRFQCNPLVLVWQSTFFLECISVITYERVSMFKCKESYDDKKDVKTMIIYISGCLNVFLMEIHLAEDNKKYDKVHSS